MSTAPVTADEPAQGRAAETADASTGGADTATGDAGTATGGAAAGEAGTATGGAAAGGAAPAVVGRQRSAEIDAPARGGPDLVTPAGPGRRSWWRAGLSALFPAEAAPRPTRRAILVGLAALVAGTVVNLLRTGGAGALDSTWIEDAAIFLNDALAKRWWETEFIPLNGYFTVGPRVIAEIATLFPLAWAPAVMSIIAALLTATCGLIAYLASGPYLRHGWLRLLVSVPVVVAPMAWDQISNDAATLQFPMLYALFWVLLWRPATRTGAAVAVLVALYNAFSAVLSVVFLPLALARVLAVRDRLGRLLLAAYGAGLAVQFIGIGLGATAQTPLRHPRYNPAWALYEYMATAVPRALFGQRLMSDESLHRPAAQWVMVLVSWVVLAVVVAVGARRAAPAWGLAVIAAGHSVALFGLSVTQMGTVQPRYVLPPALLLYTAIAALLRPPPGQPARPGTGAGRPAGRRTAVLAVTAVVAAVLSVAAVANYRMPNGRSRTPSWSSAMAGAQTACAAHQEPWAYYWRYSWWFVYIPCSYVRD